MATKDVRWWLKDGVALSRSLIEQTDRLLKLNAERHRMDLRHARLYGGAEILGLAPGLYSRVSQLTPRLKLNVIKSCVETAVSKVCKNRPAPQFLTNGADYATRRKAAKLSKFGKGAAHQSGWYERDPQQVRDCAIFGTGLLKFYAEGEGAKAKLRCERALPWEVLVDPMEALYGEPRTMVHRRWADRSVVLEQFSGGRGEERRLRAIEEAEAPKRSETTPGRDETCDQIELIEAWHLPSGPDAGDGLHVILVRGTGNTVLLKEEWKRDAFPFSVLRWEDGLVGFWGTGIAENTTGIQFEINALLGKIQTQMRKMGRTITIVDGGSGVPTTHIDNSLDAVYVVNPGSQAPHTIAQQSVHPELIEQVWALRIRAFEENGLNEMQTSGTVPAGLTNASGKAIRAWNETGDGRLVIYGRRREYAFLDSIRRMLEIAREVPGFSIDVPNKRETERISWKDVAVEEDGYVLQMFPVSLLSQSLSGRIADVQEMAAAGWISQDRALELLDIPDLEDLWAQVTSTQRHVRSRIDEILDGEPAGAPEPRMNLRVALEHVTAAYLEAIDHGAPEDVLQEMRNYQDQITELVAQAGAQQQPAPAPQLAAPPAAAPAPIAA